jgi:hypothetical protein
MQLEMQSNKVKRIEEAAINGFFMSDPTIEDVYDKVVTLHGSTINLSFSAKYDINIRVAFETLPHEDSSIRRSLSRKRSVE